MISPTPTTNTLSIVSSSTLPPLLLFVLILRPSYSSPGREIDELTTELMFSSMVTVVAESSSVAVSTSTVDSHQESEGSIATITPASVRHWLSVTLVRVETESVLLEWSCSPAVRQQLVTCQARYGILTPEKAILQEPGQVRRWWRFEQTQVDVVDHFLPDSARFSVAHLTGNSSYVFALICRDVFSNIFTSNPIFFTTNLATSEPLVSSGYPSRFRSSVNPDWNPQLDPVKWTKSERNKTPSYSIIIGVVCGLVGFLIINVTVVMALRKYSHWQQRQLRIRQMRYIYGSNDRYYDVI